ncbi:1-phosphofructokinase family hexose kinase [Nocardia sp. NPDC059239]|uniref:1-phosphofructokinase family hexose kinase n=1 Tax=unclassified Nocardia TaxID=2637762 RepID=UPI00369C81DD
MPIVTLTMNPAIDIAAGADRIRPTSKTRCTPPRFDPGGGGINAARTIAALGEPVTAIFPAGGPSGRQLEELVRDAGVPMRSIPISGHTRENLAVTDNGSGDQFRFVFPGPRVTAPELHLCLSEIERAAVGSRYVVASGSLPPGVPDDLYQTLADLLRDLGVRLILDTSGAALRAVRYGVHLLKPSVRELAELTGHPLPDRKSQLAAARELILAGVCEIVVVSLGASGALAVTRYDDEWFPSLEVTVRSGIGAGDAMVGAMTVGLARGYPLDEAVRLGIAAATAALTTPGTRPGHPARIAELYQQEPETRPSCFSPAGSGSAETPVPQRRT